MSRILLLLSLVAATTLVAANAAADNHSHPNSDIPVVIVWHIPEVSGVGENGEPATARKLRAVVVDSDVGLSMWGRYDASDASTQVFRSPEHAIPFNWWMAWAVNELEARSWVVP